MSEVFVINKSKMFKNQWPQNQSKRKETCFISYIDNYKFFFNYATVGKILSKFNKNEIMDILNKYDLLSEDRIISNNQYNFKRKINSLGFGATIKFSIIIGLLEQKSIFAFPIINYDLAVFDTNYWYNFWKLFFSENIEIHIFESQLNWVKSFEISHITAANWL